QHFLLNPTQVYGWILVGTQKLLFHGFPPDKVAYTTLSGIYSAITSKIRITNVRCARSQEARSGKLTETSLAGLKNIWDEA
ncbi:MAG: hypothetical protein LBU64_14375, partial [Planctomycetota bacterium]|nr:hypothetical protein [Planctomycetota bacterium]